MFHIQVQHQFSLEVFAGGGSTALPIALTAELKGSFWKELYTPGSPEGASGPTALLQLSLSQCPEPPSCSRRVLTSLSTRRS